MKNEKLKFYRDWECEGALRIETPRTYGLYQRLKRECANLDMSNYKMFAAFTVEQFGEGMKAIGVEDAGQLVEVNNFVFGLKDGIEAYEKEVGRIYKSIREEVDPQEAYIYEYNNHECMITRDDGPAMKVIIETFGFEAASRVNRWDEGMSMEDFKKVYNYGRVR